MPARSIITARQERLGAELRKLRERAGLTGREAARAAGIAETKISAMEAARVGVSAERVRHLTSQYACDDAALLDALTAMATERGSGWWEEYRGLVPAGYLEMAELEDHATHLRTFQSAHIPGLLQTEAQVRALLVPSVPKLSDEDLERRVTFRIARQRSFDGTPPAPYEAVIHEAALRIRAGDRKVARDQLLHILDRSELPHVTVRVVPFDVNGFAGINHPMLYAGSAHPQLDTVYLDTPHGGEFAHAEAQLSRCRGVLSMVEHAALSVLESKDFIHSLVQSM
ncbi:helix-turn-helix domain-containing protein [Streptomyces sp. NPDC055189]